MEAQEPVLVSPNHGVVLQIECAIGPTATWQGLLGMCKSVSGANPRVTLALTLDQKGDPREDETIIRKLLCSYRQDEDWSTMHLLFRSRNC